MGAFGLKISSVFLEGVLDAFFDSLACVFRIGRKLLNVNAASKHVTNYTRARQCCGWKEEPVLKMNISRITPAWAC